MTIGFNSNSLANYNALSTSNLLKTMNSALSKNSVSSYGVANLDTLNNLAKLASDSALYRTQGFKQLVKANFDNLSETDDEISEETQKLSDLIEKSAENTEYGIYDAEGTIQTVAAEGGYILNKSV